MSVGVLDRTRDNELTVWTFILFHPFVDLLARGLYSGLIAQVHAGGVRIKQGIDAIHLIVGHERSS